MTIKDITIEIASDSTLHGLPKIVKNTGFHRIYWIILVTCGLSAAIYCNFSQSFAFLS
jgi:hypothetical protein